jgi:hypothetical protein
LASSVDRYLAEAQVTPPAGELLGLVAPHAGHMYSGPVAACAFKCAQGLSVDVVAVLCPSHYVDLAPVLTTTHSAYRTPLGDIPVEREALAALRAAVPMLPVARDPEHALEIELPFLQRTLVGEFKLIPIMMRDQGRALAEALAGALAATLRGRRALLVASSDLSHFNSQPVAEALDSYVLGRIAAYDPAGVLEAEETGQGAACGKGAIAAVLWAARALGAAQAQVVKHATSGDVTGDYQSVVGYGAAVIWK